MKKIVSLALLGLFMAGSLIISSAPASAASRVRGYYRSSGTYVQPHYRSTPNRYKSDNYSTKGNYNPYTGKKGYKKY